MSSTLKGNAALVPLDYGDRVEHAVVYESGDWEDLVEILYRPGRFFAEARNMYRGVPPPAWDLRTPISISLQPLTDATSDLLFGVSFLLPDLLPGPGILTASTIDIKEALYKAYPEGHLLVVFAIHTTSLRILYVPKTTDQNGPLRFTQSLMPMTINNVNSLACLVHFDLDLPAGPAYLSYYRAAFVADYLERKSALLGVLGNAPDIYSATTVPAAPGARLALPLPTMIAKPNRPKFAYQNADPIVLLEDVLPDCEGLGGGDPVPICCVCAVNRAVAYGDTCYLGSLDFKIYCPCSTKP